MQIGVSDGQVDQRWPLGLVLACALAAAVVGSRAASGESDLGRCARIEVAIERLDCYDALAKEQESDADGMSGEAESPEDALGSWEVATGRSPVDDSKEVTLTNRAVEPVHNRFGRPVFPALVLRCQQRKLEAYVYWGVYLGLENMPVVSRLDRERATSVYWAIGSTNESLFFQGRESKLIKEYQRHEQLYMEVVPYGANKVSATFNLSGLSDAIGPLRQACPF